MGQKVNPHGIRVGIIKDWDSVWYYEENPNENEMISDELFCEQSKDYLTK